MGEITANTLQLVCRKEREEFLRNKLGLAPSVEWRNPKSLHDPAAWQTVPTTLLVELGAIIEEKFSVSPAWKDRNIILLREEEECPAEWRSFSRLELDSPFTALAHGLEIALAPSNFPGAYALLEKKGEIFYEKIQSLHEIGAKVDRFTYLLEERYPVLVPQLHNLRRLSYSLLHLALESSNAQFSPIADFQVGADGDSISFSVRFGADRETVKAWKIQSSEPDAVWLNLLHSAQLAVITELTQIKQVEIKTLLSAAPTKNCSMLFFRLPTFSPNESSLNRQANFKLTPLGKLSAPPVASEQEKPAAGAGDAPTGLELNFKVKADMLENEKNNLQGLVKKKSVLISELTKDVNRAQQEVLAAQKSATKEILKMRMETEKAKNAARDATKKLSFFQRKMEEKAAAEKVTADSNAEPARDYEKELKQVELNQKNAEQKTAEANRKVARLEELLARQRKEAGDLMAEFNVLKAANFKLEQGSDKSDTANVVGSDEGTEEKLKTARRQLMDARAREQELEKEVKKLTIKCEAAEKNLAAKSGVAQKQLEMAEKVTEESKRQNSIASSKIEELKSEIKKKIEENNSSERILKSKVEELNETLRQKNLELEKQAKKLLDLEGKSGERKAS